MQAGDIKLHINDIGEGYPVICIHGGGPGASGWSNFKQNVPAISAKYRMILMDMPNFGHSDMVVSDKGRLTVCAEAVDAMMDELKIDRAHFIGNSIGAQSVLRLAIDRPERVNRLVAMGNNAFQHGFFMPRRPRASRSSSTTTMRKARRWKRCVNSSTPWPTIRRW